ncbi:RNA polymerase sigma factor [Labilibacter marinus]|uniref:RNA polymerase sigma factor n=1 Tax=Labilibacter marinus TaxID=1477105 RepID=UPI00094FBB81|nr:sigma-70 family RNA polymerase sigma factor [Labilibacter marinus]
MTNKEVLNELKTGNKEVIASVYLKYRDEFLFFLKRKYSVNNDIAIEVYHEAFYAFHLNIITGKLQELTSSLKTYLFQIGRNLFLNELNRSKRTDEISFKSEKSETYDHIDDSNSEKIEVLRKALLELGNKCRALLKLFYFDNMPNELIKDKLNYATVNSVKTQKYKCFNQLKKRVLSDVDKNDLYN